MADSIKFVSPGLSSVLIRVVFSFVLSSILFSEVVSSISLKSEGCNSSFIVTGSFGETEGSGIWVNSFCAGYVSSSDFFYFFMQGFHVCNSAVNVFDWFRLAPKYPNLPSEKV